MRHGLIHFRQSFIIASLADRRLFDHRWCSGTANQADAERDVPNRNDQLLDVDSHDHLHPLARRDLILQPSPFLSRLFPRSATSAASIARHGLIHFRQSFIIASLADRRLFDHRWCSGTANQADAERGVPNRNDQLLDVDSHDHLHPLARPGLILQRIPISLKALSSQCHVSCFDCPSATGLVLEADPFHGTRR
jgi:hypothetical protein